MANGPPIAFPAPGKLLALGALLGTLLLAGCTAGQSGVSNVRDAFAYGGQLADEQGSQSFTWQNTRGQAMVSWGGQAAEGAFTITIRDADGKAVYTGTLSAARQSGMAGSTAAGRAGAWTIVLDFEGFTGQMGLSITASGGGSGGGLGWSGAGLPPEHP